MKRFNATNAPGSCLFCGTTLRQKYWTKYAYTRVVAKACKWCVIEGSTLDAEGRCDKCCSHSTTQRKTLIERTKAHEHPGPYGDGFFCTLDCGFRFAVALARGGRRLQPAAQPPDDVLAGQRPKRS